MLVNTERPTDLYTEVSLCIAISGVYSKTYGHLRVGSNRFGIEFGIPRIRSGRGHFDKAPANFTKCFLAVECNFFVFIGSLDRVTGHTEYCSGMDQTCFVDLLKATY